MLKYLENSDRYDVGLSIGTLKFDLERSEVKVVLL